MMQAWTWVFGNTAAIASGKPCRPSTSARSGRPRPTRALVSEGPRTGASQLALPQPDLLVDRVDVVLHRLGRVVLGRRVAPTQLFACILSHDLVLVGGSAADPVGTHHLVVFEDRRRPAGDEDLAAGEDG